MYVKGEEGKQVHSKLKEILFNSYLSAVEISKYHVRVCRELSRNPDISILSLHIEKTIVITYLYAIVFMYLIT